MFTVTGFRLLPGSPPLYSLLLRLLLWLLPLLLSLLPSLLAPPIGPTLGACLMVALTFALRLFTLCVGRPQGGGEGEEEEVVWDGAIGATTWDTLLPHRHPLAGFLLQVTTHLTTHPPPAGGSWPGGVLLLPGAPPPRPRPPGSLPLATHGLAHRCSRPPGRHRPAASSACHLQVHA